ncbi:putative Rha family transcriptional regulator [Vibrio phage 501E54-1]|nr:putative Rha family transcriptional regulator [Vibrio phage 501E54-1]
MELQTLRKTGTEQEPTMTHLQFADITGKRKDSVKRTMETLSEQQVISITQSVEPQLRGGKPVTIYRVNERDSYIVMAQLDPKFTAQLVDEWKAMKEQQQVLNLPQTYLEALEALVSSEKEKEQLALENKEVKAYSERQTKYIGALEDQHASGITVPLFCKELNGVNTQQVQNFISKEKNWMHKQGGSWVASSYARDKYLSVKFKQDYMGVDRPVCYLTERGAKLLYKYYCKKELPMKTTWDKSLTPQHYLPIIGSDED